MRIAVVVTTYNRPDALAAVLEGYLAQTDRNFEVIVADDGSTDATRQMVESYRKRVPFELQHVWQEDKGFRAAAVRNRAVAATGADYIIFTDGDCIPLRDFVTRHRMMAERGWFLSGNRILLTQAFTARVLQENIPVYAWDRKAWIAARWHGDINRFMPLLFPPIPDALRKRHPTRWEGVKTCNLSVWRKDFLMVNGMDEAYSGWGMEDSDLVARLLHADVFHKSARFGAPVLHLWHAENDRSMLRENQDRLASLLRSNQTRARLGLDQYL